MTVVSASVTEWSMSGMHPPCAYGVRTEFDEVAGDKGAKSTNFRVSLVGTSKGDSRSLVAFSIQAVKVVT